MSGWGDYPGFFDWGPAKEVEGGLVARRTQARHAPTAEPGVGSELLARLSARASPGVIQRGRSYARKGQTVSLVIEPGVIRASVQGASDDPYAVTITCDVRDSARRALLAALGRVVDRPDVELPAHGSATVNVALASLDLLRGATVAATCTCPFGSVCKHTIAVGILAGERLDESPKTLATLLDVTEAAFALGADTARPVAAATFDARRQARLAAKLRRLDATPTLDRDAVLASAIAVVPAPPSVRRVLGLPADD